MRDHAFVSSTVLALIQDAENKDPSLDITGDYKINGIIEVDLSTDCLILSRCPEEQRIQNGQLTIESLCDPL